MVSVIMPTYKRPPEMIKKAVESVIQQTYKDWELIVVDDSPVDYVYRKDVALTVKSFGDDRIIYIAMEKNSGGCAARNRGIIESKGEFITFLDDDDQYLPEKLELQVQALKENPDCGWTSGTFYKCNVGSDGRIIKKTLVKNTTFTGYIFDELILGRYYPTICAMVRRGVIGEVSGFDEKLSAAQDLDFWLRIGKVSKFCIINKPLFLQCVHSGERVTRSPEKKLHAYQTILQKYSDYMENHPEAKARYIQNQVKYLIWLKRYSEAVELLEKACALDKKKAIEYRLRYIYWKMTYGRK